MRIKRGELEPLYNLANAEFEADWERNLVQLVAPDAVLEFDHAWEAVTGYVTRMAEGLDQRGQGAPQTPRVDGDGA